MKLSIQQTSLGVRSFHQIWRVAKEAGLDGLNLCYPTRADVTELCALGYAVQASDMADRYGLAVSGLHLGYLSSEPFLVSEHSLREHAQQIVREAMAVAHRLGAPCVIVPLTGANSPSSRQRLDLAGAALRELAKDADASGVNLAIESTLPYEDLRDLFAYAGSDRMKICYDTGDMAAARRYALATIRALRAEGIAQVHLKDANLATTPPDFNVRLGDGDVRFDAILPVLQSVGYDGWVVLETPPGDAEGQILALHVEDARRLLADPYGAQPSEDGVPEPSAS